MRVAVMAYDGCLASGVSGFADALRVGNLVAGREVFAVSVLGTSGSMVSGFGGTGVVVDATLDAASADAAAWDVVYVPPAFGVAGGLPELAACVGRAHAAGAIACAACAGVFVLAEAGILGGRTATTHWALAGDFAARHPDVGLDAGRILVDDGDVVCAGGVTAYFDLALRLTARFASPEAAARLAQTLLLDPGRSSQAPYASLLAAAPHGDAAIEAVQRRIEDNLQRPISVAALAATAHLSERTLLRRFRRATGRSPKEYVIALRVELAKRLLATTDRTAQDIATEAGYTDATAFYRLFREIVGVPPGEYRRRFNCFAPQASR